MSPFLDGIGWTAPLSSPRQSRSNPVSEYRKPPRPLLLLANHRMGIGQSMTNDNNGGTFPATAKCFCVTSSSFTAINDCSIESFLLSFLCLSIGFYCCHVNYIPRSTSSSPVAGPLRPWRSLGSGLITLSGALTPFWSVMCHIHCFTFPGTLIINRIERQLTTLYVCCHRPNPDIFTTICDVFWVGYMYG